MAGTKGHSGGKRPGSGQPRRVKTTSEQVQARWMKAARKVAREKGMPVEEAILLMVYDTNVQDACRVGAAKLYCEVLVAKVSEKHINVKQQTAPQIYLPPMRPDPALQIVKKKAVNE